MGYCGWSPVLRYECFTQDGITSWLPKWHDSFIKYILDKKNYQKKKNLKLENSISSLGIFCYRLHELHAKNVSHLQPIECVCDLDPTPFKCKLWQSGPESIRLAISLTEFRE